MSENFTDTTLLIQFLDGELDEIQYASVKKRIEENASLKEELEKLILAKEALKSYGLKNKIGSIHFEMMNELKVEAAPGPGIVRSLFKYSFRVAAAVFLVLSLSVLYQYFSASADKLFNENFEAFNLHEMRGATISPLVGAYKNGNMQMVIQQLDTLKDPQPQDYFLAGNALLVNHQPAKAIQALLALQLKNKTNNTHYYEEDAEYYLALSYLDNNEPDKSIPIFEKIHADKEHPYYKKISSWFISKLKRLATTK